MIIIIIIMTTRIYLSKLPICTIQHKHSIVLYFILPTPQLLAPISVRELSLLFTPGITVIIIIIIIKKHSWGWCFHGTFWTSISNYRLEKSNNPICYAPDLTLSLHRVSLVMRYLLLNVWEHCHHYCGFRVLSNYVLDSCNEAIYPVWMSLILHFYLTLLCNF